MNLGADWREYDVAPLPRVLDAALGVFAEKGFHGTSIRDIAGRAGLSVPGLYHHYRSKQDILMDLVLTVMGELLSRSRAAVESGADDPVARLDALVESLLRFHMFRRDQAFVASSEIRSLLPENRAAYVALRDEQQQMLEDLITAGEVHGAFATPSPKEAARAVSTLCVGVASWFREDGPQTPDEVVARYLVMVHGLLGNR
ncbi:TetR/AcrR family transcriptional regulator [Nocardioides marmoriginsengisoli]|uniref:TetR/AcrR family transcriptional regulator n=1 Tax=Nocardioides marmoriginsengisoli TaxID=661483 RepID=A0A3N0CH95_9ACTN|nr:TetR/AcrR family transcriptional regulator [Nocardioides marmoriginsengisoli]RNL62822.1 TetR/AcrR family transcriptional regulator [Nocardioides marmoriginsengisoli]